MRDAPLILLVEDSWEIQRVNSRMLTRRGYRVESAMTLAEARDRLRASPPDLVVLDILLPDGDGLDFCAELRALRAEMPILFLTARDKVSDIVKGLEGGGDDYLTKPYDYDVFAARVEALLRRAGQNRQQRREIGPITLDYARQRAYLHGEDALLKPREFALLALLVEHMGENMTPEALYETIWGAEVNSDLRTVYVHIAGLRRKLRMEGTRGLRIENEREKWYRLVL